MGMNDENMQVGERFVKKHFLPDAYYESDTGNLLFAVMFPIEIPYKISQILKNGFYHTFRLEHQHI